MVAKWFPDLPTLSDRSDRRDRVRSRGSTLVGGLAVLVLGSVFIASAFPPMNGGNGSILLGPLLGTALLVVGTYLAFIGAARLDK